MADSVQVTGYASKTVPCSVIDQDMDVIGPGTQQCKAEMKSGMIALSIPRRVIGAVAAIMLVSFGIAAVWAWSPRSTNVINVAVATSNFPEQSEVNELSTARCEECGVVESIRKIERSEEGSGKTAGRYEMTRAPLISQITVRMSDGDSHLFTDASLANWRPGERIIIIKGTTR